MDHPPLARAAPLLAALFAVAAPALHPVTGLGQGIGAYAARGDEVLRAAPYAFAVWSLLYVGMLAYGVAAWRDRDGAAAALRGPATVAFLGCGLWVLAAQFDLAVAAPVILVVSAAGLTLALWRAAADLRGLRVPLRLVSLWPLAALAGWLCTASVLNLVGTAVRFGVLAGAPARVAAALLVLTAAALVSALAVRLRDLAAALTPAWGLLAVWAAQRGESWIAPLAAGTAAAVLAVGLLWAWPGPLARRPAA